MHGKRHIFVDRHLVDQAEILNMTPKAPSWGSLRRFNLRGRTR
jgi:hypothetical protein